MVKLTEEFAMVSKPTPQQIRDYMAQRRADHTPPPSAERVREMLGWKMLPNNRRNPWN